MHTLKSSSRDSVVKALDFHKANPDSSLAVIHTSQWRHQEGHPALTVPTHQRNPTVMWTHLCLRKRQCTMLKTSHTYTNKRFATANRSCINIPVTKIFDHGRWCDRPVKIFLASSLSHAKGGSAVNYQAGICRSPKMLGPFGMGPWLTQKTCPDEYMLQCQIWSF